MKIKGQSKKGRIIIDGEGERVEITKPVPAESPVVLTNFTFISNFEDDEVEKGK